MATIHSQFDTQSLKTLFEIQAPGSPTISVILLIPSLNTLAGSTKRLLPPLVYLRELYQILSLQNWTPQKQRGRKPNLNTPTQQRLIARAKLNRFHQRKPLEEIVMLEGVSACKRSLYKAFKKEGYLRRVAIEKPLIIPKQWGARKKWAYSHLKWTPKMWAAVLWRPFKPVEARSLLLGVLRRNTILITMSLNLGGIQAR